MKWELAALVGTLSLALAGAFADERKNENTEATKKKLAGVWIAQEGGKTPAGSTFEVSKDGHFRSVLKVSGTEIIHEGTYRIEGDKITATHRRKDGSEKVRVLKILKLSDNDLTVSDDDEKTTLKKKKSE
ncbi:MAG: hypothetical protein ACJ8FY_26610 [Gemmataceae bacterium]